MSIFYQTLDYRTNMEFKARKKAFKKGKPCAICGKMLKPAEMMVAHLVPVDKLTDEQALYDTNNWSCRCIYCERKQNTLKDRKSFCGYVYKCSLPDGRYYIGQHHSNGEDPLEDGYYGLGKEWTSAIQGIDKEKITKIVLAYAQTDKELDELEKHFIGDLNEADDLCLNVRRGGRGMASGEKHWAYGTHPSGETIEKLKQYHKENPKTGKDNPMFGKHPEPWNKGKAMSEEQKKKISLANKGKKLSEEQRRAISERMKGKNNPMYGKIFGVQKKYHPEEDLLNNIKGK